MRKIIIKTNSDQPDFFLISYIRSLFPDCEIQIVKRDGKTPPIQMQAVTKTESLL